MKQRSAIGAAVLALGACVGAYALVWTHLRPDENPDDALFKDRPTPNLGWTPPSENGVFPGPTLADGQPRPLVVVTDSSPPHVAFVLYDDGRWLRRPRRATGLVSGRLSSEEAESHHRRFRAVPLRDVPPQVSLRPSATDGPFVRFCVAHEDGWVCSTVEHMVPDHDRAVHEAAGGERDAGVRETYEEDGVERLRPRYALAVPHPVLEANELVQRLDLEGEPWSGELPSADYLDGLGLSFLRFMGLDVK